MACGWNTAGDQNRQPLRECLAKPGRIDRRQARPCECPDDSPVKNQEQYTSDKNGIGAHAESDQNVGAKRPNTQQGRQSSKVFSRHNAPIN